MKLTNFQMDQMADTASAHLGRRDMIGYACARNVRMLSDVLTEYVSVRNELLAEHGERGGDGEVFLTAESPGFPAFAEAIEPFGVIEHDFEPFRIPYGEAIGKLSGTELLGLDWMFADE